jgi:hypothetical protein
VRLSHAVKLAIVITVGPRASGISYALPGFLGAGRR